MAKTKPAKRHQPKRTAVVRRTPEDRLGQRLYRLADQHGMYVKDVVRHPLLLAAAGIDTAACTPAAISAGRALELAYDEALPGRVAAFNSHYG